MYVYYSDSESFMHNASAACEREPRLGPRAENPRRSQLSHFLHTTLQQSKQTTYYMAPEENPRPRTHSQPLQIPVGVGVCDGSCAARYLPLQ